MPRGEHNNHKGGRPKGSVGTSTLYGIELRKLIVEEVRKNEAPFVKGLVKLAVTGNVQAYKEILERVIGKETDKIEVQTPMSEILKRIQQNNKAITED